MGKGIKVVFIEKAKKQHTLYLDGKTYSDAIEQLEGKAFGFDVVEKAKEHGCEEIYMLFIDTQMERTLTMDKLELSVLLKKLGKLMAVRIWCEDVRSCDLADNGKEIRFNCWDEDRSVMEFTENEGKYYAVSYKTYYRHTLLSNIVLDEEVDITILVKELLERKITAEKRAKENPLVFPFMTEYDDMFIVANRIKLGEEGYVIENLDTIPENEFSQAIKIVHIIRRSDNPKHYDDSTGEQLAVECPCEYDLSAEFVEDEESYYVFFNYC